MPDTPEVLEADPVAGQRPGRRVREAQVDRERQRTGDEHGDEDDGGRDENGRKDAATLEDVPPAPSPRPCGGDCLHLVRILTFT